MRPVSDGIMINISALVNEDRRRIMRIRCLAEKFKLQWITVTVYNRRVTRGMRRGKWGDFIRDGIVREDSTAQLICPRGLSTLIIFFREHICSDTFYQVVSRETSVLSSAE